MANETTTPSDPRLARNVAIWSGALENALFCIPPDDRLAVLEKLMADEIARRKQPTRLAVDREQCAEISDSNGTSRSLPVRRRRKRPPNRPSQLAFDFDTDTAPRQDEAARRGEHHPATTNAVTANPEFHQA
jgi:hypothetical protein